VRAVEERQVKDELLCGELVLKPILGWGILVQGHRGIQMLYVDGGRDRVQGKTGQSRRCRSHRQKNKYD
jgi:hypothetical protein